MKPHLRLSFPAEGHLRDKVCGETHASLLASNGAYVAVMMIIPRESQSGKLFATEKERSRDKTAQIRETYVEWVDG